MTISNHPSPSEADQEMLSAYLDNALSAAERLTIERRLQQEPGLRLELNELRIVKSMLNDLQPVVPPRSFTLNPATVGRPRGLPLFALLRLGGALATILLALTLTLDLFGSSRTTSAPIAASQALSATQPTSGFSPQAAPAAAPTSNAAVLQAPASDAAAPPPVANSEATVAPAAAAPMTRAGTQATAPAAAELQSQESLQATAPAVVAAEGAGATDATQAAKGPPALGAQPAVPGASDTSSPDTNRTALPPPPAPSIGISALRWAEIVLAALAIACGLGAFLAWQQRR